ncbi:Immunoglobulin V-set domain [Pristimantis euphronides]
MRRREQVIFYLCTVLIAVGAITVETPQKVVEAGRGQNATLPCRYQTTAQDMSTGIVNWKRKTANEVIAYLAGQIQTYVPYKDRVQFIGSVTANDASIRIGQLRMEDNGTYQCNVIIASDFDGTSLSYMDLIVLVSPSKPICGIVGTAEYGQVIKITCNSEEGSPSPQYSWKSFTSQDVERQLPQTAVIDKGELTLKNISMETSGFFICTSTNKIGTQSCNITLSVMPPSMNIALYAGVIGGSLAGIIVIGIIAYCCCCRNKEDKEDYEMADREEEEEEEEESDHRPQEKKQQKQQHQQKYQDDEGEDSDVEDNLPRKPPMPPGNKPRLVIHPVDA